MSDILLLISSCFSSCNGECLARLSLQKCLSCKILARRLQEKWIFFKDKNVRILQDTHFFGLGYKYIENNYLRNLICSGSWSGFRLSRSLRMLTIWMKASLASTSNSTRSRETQVAFLLTSPNSAFS